MSPSALHTFRQIPRRFSTTLFAPWLSVAATAWLPSILRSRRQPHDGSSGFYQVRYRVTATRPDSKYPLHHAALYEVVLQPCYIPSCVRYARGWLPTASLPTFAGFGYKLIQAFSYSWNSHAIKPDYVYIPEWHTVCLRGKVHGHYIHGKLCRLIIAETAMKVLAGVGSMRVLSTLVVS